MKHLQLLIVLVAAGFLSGCTISTGDPQLTGAGVTFVVPMQSSQSNYGPFGIDYKSNGFSASTDGKTLLVDGNSYGAVTAGDVVDFTEPGVVKVNGAVRTVARP